MRRPSGALILFIVLVTILAFLVNVPDTLRLNFSIPRIPGINQQFTINRTVELININTLLRPLGIERNIAFRRGLDLEGGTSVTLQADMSDIPQSQREDAINAAREVIERRVNFFGVAEPSIQTARVNDEYRIIVEIPGVTDVNQAVSLIGQTAQLSFWEEGASESAQIASPSAYPLGVVEILGPNARPTELTGSDLQKAAVTFNPNTGQPQVQLTFTREGSRKFAEITRRNVGNIVGIVLDDMLIQAPRVNEPIIGGTAEITGQFTIEQARQLQIQLSAGALPVSLSVLEQRAIGATLGNQTVQNSLVAGVIGFVVIAVFMIALYGKLGVVAVLALTVYALLTLSAFRLIPVTLTLAGIAGFILSLGIAVDANILIFERMREEMRKGKSEYAALDIGFSRAWSSIRDSNIASLITSAILLVFGTGIVRGFAFTLAIGVIISLFTAITVTRTLLKIMYR